MAKRSAFVDHVIETMRLFGLVEARSMFGGWGLYHGGVFFALVAEDALYLKVDDETRPEFVERGLEPWVYAIKDGKKSIALSYYQAPEDALESPPQMEPWARKAYGAALRAAARKKKAAAKKEPDVPEEKPAAPKKKAPAKRR
jgi:DNA transformation protein